MKQRQTDECVFSRYVSNIIGQPSLTNEDLLVNGKSLNMDIMWEKPCALHRSSGDALRAMIILR